MLELCSDIILVHDNDNGEQDILTLQRGTYFISFIIEDHKWQDFMDTHKNIMADIIAYCFKKTGIIPLKNRCDNIQITLTNNDNIQIINKGWLNKDKPTNVLSFPSFEPEEIQSHAYHTESDIEFGDIIIAWEYCQNEAGEANIPFLEHIAHMLIHGMLHILGYDHNDYSEATIMEALETQILKEFGFANPYDIV